MKLFATITALSLLFCTALAGSKGSLEAPGYPDSLRTVYLYTDGIKSYLIHGDTTEARRLLREAILSDSLYAPAYYELATIQAGSDPLEAITLSRRAAELDSANKWYRQFYGQALIMSDRYDEALRVYRRMTESDPKDPDNYRILAALYEQQNNPYMALATLDSAELRFGRIPLLGVMKRRLLVGTRQTDKAIAEARALLDAAPYEAEHHVALAELYAISGKDSLARAQYTQAMQIDSTSLGTLMSLSDFYNDRRDYDSYLSTLKRLFLSDMLPLATKVKRFEQLTADQRFYREFYLRINDLASTLAIRYPKDKSVVVLYAKHLIASGELDQALALYKLHLDDEPPQEEYFRWVIDIESYRRNPDSVRVYVDRALKLFPDKPDFHLFKGNSLSVSKDYAGAVKAYKETLRFATTDSLKGVVWGLIGDTWQQKALAHPSAARSAMRECYKSYDRSLSYYKDNPLVLNNYAYFLSLEGRDLERALEMSSRVVALTDNNPTYLDTHAWVLFRLGRTAEARKVLQQAVALDGQNSPELLVHYGDVLHALGDQFLAESYWRKALEKGYDAAQIERRFQQGKTKPE